MGVVVPVSDLFRKEAVQHAARRLSGDVILASSLSSKVLAALLMAAVLAGVAFAATASYARKETVSGWLTPKGGMIRLAARQGGIITGLHVSEGQMVAVGQPIATLTLSSALTGGDSYEALADSLEDQRLAATSRARAAVAVLKSEQRQAAEHRTALGRELAETRRRIALQRERVELGRSEVERAEAMAAQGYLPRRDLEARRSAALALDQEASVLATQALSLEQEIAEVTSRVRTIPIEIGSAEADAASASAGLQLEATQAEASATYVVVATVAGRIGALPLGVGQTAEPGAVVAIVTAGAAALEAELYAPSSAAGFLRTGQEVRLMYQAFPHQKFGVGQGTVTSVSRTVLAPNEISVPGLRIDEPVFRMRVRLRDDSVAAYGERVPLQPGMLLSADIVVDRRSLLEWLLDPLYAAGRR